MTELTQALFAGLVGERFDLFEHADGVAVGTVSLSAIEALPSDESGWTPYSLIFRGDASVLLAQQTWLVRHLTLGTVPIFLGPIARDADGTTYQAVFN